MKNIGFDTTEKGFSKASVTVVTNQPPTHLGSKKTSMAASSKGLMLICIAPSRVASADRAVWKSGCVCSVRARSRSKIPERSLFIGLVDPCGDRGSEHTCLPFSDKFDK